MTFNWIEDEAKFPARSLAFAFSIGAGEECHTSLQRGDPAMPSFRRGVFVSFSGIGSHVSGDYNPYRKPVNMKRAIWTVVIVSLALLTVAIAVNLNDRSTPILVTSIPYTSTPSSPPTRTRTPQPPSLNLPGCVLWYEFRNDLVGENVCVLGYIKVRVRPDSNSDAVRIYLKPDLSRGERRRVGAPKDFYLFDEFFSYTDLRIDDCVTASGILSINNDGILFMRLDNNLQKCP